MRSRRGRLLAAAIGLLVLIITTSLLLVAIAGPVLVVVVLAMIALVAGLATRLPPRSPSRHTEEVPRPTPRAETRSRDTGTAAPDPQWVMQWESGPSASAVPFARDQLIRVLAEWGLAGEAGEPTQLVVTELLSNAIDHARPPIQLTVSFPGESVRVEVHDATVEPPQQQPHDPSRLRGRGLQMVDALSLQWGWTTDAAGKTVWANVSIGWPPH